MEVHNSELTARAISNIKAFQKGIWLTSDDLFESLAIVLGEVEHSSVKVLNERKGIPTVIEWKGDRFTFDAGSTFRGGVQRGKRQTHKT